MRSSIICNLLGLFISFIFLFILTACLFIIYSLASPAGINSLINSICSGLSPDILSKIISLCSLFLTFLILVSISLIDFSFIFLKNSCLSSGIIFSISLKTSNCLTSFISLISLKIFSCFSGVLALAIFSLNLLKVLFLISITFSITSGDKLFSNSFTIRRSSIRPSSK